MSDSAKSVKKPADKTKTSKFSSWYKGLKGQFKSITWPNRQTAIKQSTAVVAITFILGVVITVIDVIIRFGLEFLVK